MRERILDFVAEYPIVLLLLVPLLPLVFYRRYRRMQRRVGHINDANSLFMLAIGFMATAVVIGVWLVYF
jgi:hypothetical protein